jgi:imidazolonepropionase-like amidohydrolase
MNWSQAHDDRQIVVPSTGDSCRGQLAFRGSIAPGRYGDLIAVKGDPLQDIGRLQDVAHVVKGGIVVR